MFKRGTRRFKALSQGLCGGHLCGETSTQLPLGDTHNHGGRLVAYVWTRGTRGYMVLWGHRACAGRCERKKTLKRLKRPAGKGALFSAGIFPSHRYFQRPRAKLDHPRPAEMFLRDMVTFIMGKIRENRPWEVWKLFSRGKNIPPCVPKVNWCNESGPMKIPCSSEEPGVLRPCPRGSVEVIYAGKQAPSSR